MIKFSIAPMAVLVSLVVSLIQCAPSQQPSEQNALAQGSFGPGGEYSNSILGDSSISLGRPAYSNNKRARKMSAFMPMRGRKDGRDELANMPVPLGGGQLVPMSPARAEVAADSGESLLMMQYPLREADNTNANILRLLTGLVVNDQEPELSSIRMRLMNGQRQPPYSQFVVPNNQVEPPREQRDQSRQLASDQETGGQLEQVAGATLSSAPTTLMQAKLRRAFHPMRGKKSDQNQQIQQQIAAAEMALANELFSETD